MMIQIETTQILNDAIDLRIVKTGQHSRRAFVLALVVKELADEIKTVQDSFTNRGVPATSDTILPAQGAIIKRGVAKRTGNAKAESVALSEDMDIDKVRQFDRRMIRNFYEGMISDGEIPPSVLWRFFFLGWRGKFGQAVQQHGTYNCYAKGCRCKPCGSAWRVYQKNARSKRRKKVLLRRDTEQRLADETRAARAEGIAEIYYAKIKEGAE